LYFLFHDVEIGHSNEPTKRCSEHLPTKRRSEPLKAKRSDLKRNKVSAGNQDAPAAPRSTVENQDAAESTDENEDNNEMDDL
jgi:hypothetical protein